MGSFAAALCAGGIGVANAQQPTAQPSYPAGMTDLQLNALLAQAVAEIRAKNGANDARWGIGDWSVDLAQGWIGFATRDGGRVQADVQVIGTYVVARRSWMWGWDHPSVPEPGQAHARLVKQFAATQALVALQQRVMEDVGEDEVWGFTSQALPVLIAGRAAEPMCS